MPARTGALYEIPRVPPRRPLEPVTHVIITPEGERQMSAVLSRLRHQLEVDFPDRLREARAFGEIDHNDDYLQIKEEEAVLAARIQQLQSVLSSAKVIDPDEDGGGLVTIGNLVEIEDRASGKTRTYRLIGGHGHHGPDDVSASSPIGRALFGRTVGEEVAVALPNGRRRTLKITAVRAPVNS